MTNCYNKGEIIGLNGATYVGGVTGTDLRSIITNCHNTGEVTSHDSPYVGGITSTIFMTTINNCYNSGSVTGSRSVAGITGLSFTANINDCYNSGTITGGEQIEHANGGIIGLLKNSELKNSYNIGSINVSGTSGSLVGYSDNGKINNCYTLINSGKNNGLGIIKNDKNMQNEEFVDQLNSKSQTKLWQMDLKAINEKFPIFEWQTESTIGIKNNEKNNLKVYSHDNNIYIENFENKDKQVTIYDLQGKVINKITITDTKTIIKVDLKGIYIVFCDETGHKVVCR